MELNISNSPTAPGRKCLRQGVNVSYWQPWPVLLGCPVLLRCCCCSSCSLFPFLNSQREPQGWSHEPPRYCTCSQKRCWHFDSFSVLTVKPLIVLLCVLHPWQVRQGPSRLRTCTDPKMVPLHFLLSPCLWDSEPVTVLELCACFHLTSGAVGGTGPACFPVAPFCGLVGVT